MHPEDAFNWELTGEPKEQLLRRIYKIGHFTRSGNRTTINWSRQTRAMCGLFDTTLTEQVDWVDVYPFGDDSDDELMAQPEVSPPATTQDVEEEDELDEVQFISHVRHPQPSVSTDIDSDGADEDIEYIF
jgi:hypothetical protein